jgi:hypothetical protein
VTVVQPGEREHVALLGDVATRTIWNAGSEPGRIIEIITPGGFENYVRELGELLVEHANDPLGKVLHELPEFGERADNYGLT